MSPLSNFVPSTYKGAPSSEPSTPITPSPSFSDVEEECVSCRIFGGSTFAGLGGYAIYESIHQGALRKGGDPKTRVMSLGALGSAMVVLGLGRLAGMRIPGGPGSHKVAAEGGATSSTASMLASGIKSTESLKSE